MELLGRSDELARMEASWKAAARRPQLVLLTGRRRVGKTSLVAAFAVERRSAVFSATREASAVQLSRFAEALAAARPDIVLPTTFANWREALAFAASMAEREPLLVAMDEVPYLDEVDRAFGSIVQAAWDEVLHGPRRSKLLLVLTGSSTRVMSRLTAGGGPLFGRADLALRLEPFAFEQAGLFVPKLRPADLLQAYAVTGGYPRHLLAWDDQSSMEANVSELVRPGSLLFDDASLILHEEFPIGIGFDRVLRAIGRGRHSYGEIKTEADLRVEGPLSAMEHVGLVRGELPLGGPRRAAPHYVITDPYLRFWFGPLARVRQGIEMGGDASLVLHSGLWATHLGSVFEDEARRHAVRKVNAGELPASTVGRFWRSGRQPVEIDVVGRAEDRVVFVGEAKWSNTAPNVRVINELHTRADRAFGSSAELVTAFWSRRRFRTPSRPALHSYSIEDMATT